MTSVPGPAPAVHPRASSSTTSVSAMPTAARNGTRPGRETASSASHPTTTSATTDEACAQPDDHGAGDQHGGGDEREAAGADAVGEAAYAGGGVVVQVGQDVQQV